MNNNFLNKTGARVSMLYNDKSALQNHACASLFKLISKVEDAAMSESAGSRNSSPASIFSRAGRSDRGSSVDTTSNKSKTSGDLHESIISHMSEQDHVRLRRRVIEAILKTDMVYHFDLLTSFQKALAKKTISKNLFCGILVHSATMSNTVRHSYKTRIQRMRNNPTDLLQSRRDQIRTFDIANMWAIKMQEEFFFQGDLESSRGMPVSPFMDRACPNLPKMQIGFIDAVVTPLFKALGGFLPSLNETCVSNLTENRQMWDTLRRKRLKRSDSANPSEGFGDSPNEIGRILSSSNSKGKSKDNGKSSKIEPFAGEGTSASPPGLKKRRGSVVVIEQRQPSAVRRLSSGHASISPRRRLVCNLRLRFLCYMSFLTT